MKEATIDLNGKKLICHYEFTKGEPQTRDYIGSNPSVRLWNVTDENDNDLTGTFTQLEWCELENKCFEISNNN